MVPSRLRLRALPNIMEVAGCAGWPFEVRFNAVISYVRIVDNDWTIPDLSLALGRNDIAHLHILTSSSESRWACRIL